LFHEWYEPAKSRKSSLEKKVSFTDLEQVRDLLSRGVNRTDVGRQVIDDLGYQIAFWNGETEERADSSLIIRCGVFSEYVSNSIVLHLPEIETWIPNANILLESAAKIWCPEWAGIMTKKAMREREFDARNPFFDWMIYLPRKIELVSDYCIVENIRGIGSIVTIDGVPTESDAGIRLSRAKEVEKLVMN
jgi:hypothetical protein